MRRDLRKTNHVSSALSFTVKGVRAAMGGDRAKAVLQLKLAEDLFARMSMELYHALRSQQISSPACVSDAIAPGQWS